MESRTVLVVDDDRGICELVQLLLTDGDGPRVVCVGHWRKALPWLESQLSEPERPALVLVEVAPGHGGLELVKRVKSDPALAPIRVVAFGCERECREKALGAGCDTWLDKPFDVEQFMAAVRRHLDGLAC